MKYPHLKVVHGNGGDIPNIIKCKECKGEHFIKTEKLIFHKKKTTKSSGYVCLCCLMKGLITSL